MQVSKAIKIWLKYHKSHSRDGTLSEDQESAAIGVYGKG